MTETTYSVTKPINILKISDYQLMRDAYRGSGGFKNGAYIVRHRREDDEDLAERQQVSHFHNYVAPVVDAHVDPIFRKQVSRSGPTNPVWDELCKNIDQAGKGVDAFMKSAAIAARRDGLHFLSVSTPTNAPASAADEIKAMPWAYRIQAMAVTEIKRDTWGRPTSVTWSFIDGDQTLLRTLTGEGWSTTDEGGKAVEGTGMEGEWNKKRPTAPVVMMCPQDWDDDETRPTPKFYGIARANHRIFNQTSELDEIERNMCFPMWTYPSKDPGSITIGTNNIMGYDPTTTHEPNPKSPSKDAFETLAAGIKRNIDEIYRMAGLSSANVEGTKQQSGVAKQLDRAQLDASLSSYGECLSDCEQQLWDLFSWITGKDLATAVSYPTEFTTADLDIELAALQSALQIGAGPLFARLARMRMARVVLPMTDAKTLADVDAEIKNMQEADNQAGTGGQNPSGAAGSGPGAVDDQGNPEDGAV